MILKIPYKNVRTLFSFLFLFCFVLATANETVGELHIVIMRLTSCYSQWGSLSHLGKSCSQAHSLSKKGLLGPEEYSYFSDKVEIEV